MKYGHWLQISCLQYEYSISSESCRLCTFIPNFILICGQYISANRYSYIDSNGFDFSLWAVQISSWNGFDIYSFHLSFSCTVLTSWKMFRANYFIFHHYIFLGHGQSNIRNHDVHNLLPLFYQISYILSKVFWFRFSFPLLLSPFYFLVFPAMTSASSSISLGRNVLFSPLNSSMVTNFWTTSISEQGFQVFPEVGVWGQMWCCGVVSWNWTIEVQTKWHPCNFYISLLVSSARRCAYWAERDGNWASTSAATYGYRDITVLPEGRARLSYFPSGVRK